MEVIMEVMVEHLGAVQFEVRARNHAIVCDQPEKNGGFDEGMTPPELILASLGTCAGYYATEYLNTRNLVGTGMQIRVSAEKAKAPPAWPRSGSKCRSRAN
jgi:putative redox protein